MARSTRSLLGNRDFVRLWTGETISQLGSQVTLIALPLMAITILGATTLQVGFLQAAEFLPFLLIGLPAGAIVDRLLRRPVLIAADVGRALLLLSIPVAHWMGWLSLGQLMIVVFLAGICTVFFDVAYQSYLPALIERDQLTDGNAKLEISRSGAQIAGPGLAGVLVQWLTAPVAVLVDALSFGASAVAVLTIRTRETAPEAADDGDDATPRTTLRHEVREGLRYVLHHPHLRAIAGCTATSNLFSALLQTVFLVYAVRSLGFHAGTIGLIFMVGNVGFLVGAALAGRITARLGLGHAICWSIFLSGVGGVIIAFAPPTGALPWFMLGSAVMSFGSPIYNIGQVSYRQAITPLRMQGRMNATMRFMVWGTLPLGSLLGGVLGTTLGLRPAMIIGGCGGLLAVLWVVLTSVRQIPAIPAPVDAEPTVVT